MLRKKFSSILEFIIAMYPQKDALRQVSLEAEEHTMWGSPEDNDEYTDERFG